VAIAVVVCSSFLSNAATVTVESSGLGDYAAIQPVIGAALDGDVVLVKAGEYEITESVRFPGKAITVKAENDPNKTRIRMSESSPTLLNCTISGNSATRGGVPLPCHDAADANDDGRLHIGDAVSILRHLFLCGTPPPPPTLGCGIDAIRDDLHCELATGRCE